jgi:hypothetical protein
MGLLMWELTGEGADTVTSGRFEYNACRWATGSVTELIAERMCVCDCICYCLFNDTLSISDYITFICKTYPTISKSTRLLKTYTDKLSPYRAVNTPRQGFKNQSVNAVWGKNRSLFRDPYKTRK